MQARSSGRKLGRPKGALGVSRLNGKEDDSRRFLKLGISKTAIAKLTGISRTTLYSFISLLFSPRGETKCVRGPSDISPGANQAPAKAFY